MHNQELDEIVEDALSMIAPNGISKRCPNCWWPFRAMRRRQKLCNCCSSVASQMTSNRHIVESPSNGGADNDNEHGANNE